VATRIRLGDSLRPTLFNIIMDETINEAGKGYRMGDKEIKILCYAHAAVIISEDKDNLQILTKYLEKREDVN